MVSTNSIAIGIDLGTTHFSIALYKDETAKVIGQRKNLSLVYIDPQSSYIKEDEKNIYKFHTELKIHDVKRFIGLKYNELKLQRNLAYLPFKIRDNFNEIEIVLEWESTDQAVEYLTPRSIYTIILAAVRDSVEQKCKGINQIHAVITVPTFFTSMQRRTTLKTAQLAGFKSCTLLDEPLAFAWAYLKEHKDLKENNYFLIYNLGGGSFEVTICQVTKIMENCIVGTSNGSKLSGVDFDNVIFDYFCAFLIGIPDFDATLLDNAVNLQQLHAKAEETKRNLSTSDDSSISFSDIFPNTFTMDLVLTRNHFELLANHLFVKTLEIVEKCLGEHFILKSSIQKAILYGGSARIPKIQNILSCYFDGRIIADPTHSLYVAQGAALYSGNMFQQNHPRKVMKTATSFIGVGLNASDFVKTIIEKNTPLPCSRIVTYSRSKIKNHICQFNVYASKYKSFKEKHCLKAAELKLSKTSCEIANQILIVIKLRIDEYGKVIVSAEEKFKNGSNKLRFLDDQIN